MNETDETTARTDEEARPPDAGPTDPGPRSAGTSAGMNAGMNTEGLRDYRRLRRSRSDRKIAGVCGGLGRHLDVDPLVLRVLFVVLVFFGGSGLLLYAALWLFVPEEGTERAHIRTSDSTRNVLLISVLVLAGLAAVADATSGGFPWFLAVVALIVAAVLIGRDSDRRQAATPPAYGPPPPVAGGSGPPPPPTGSFTVPPPPGAVPPGAQGFGPAYPPPPPPAPPRRTGRLLFGITVALGALALGLLGLVDAAGADVTDAAYPALALAVVGAMLVVGAFWGRAGGLILLGIVVALVLGATAVGEPTYDGDRDLVLRPTSAVAVEDRYDVPAGRIELDLTGVRDLDALDGRTIAVDASAGEILVTVPDDIAVTYTAQVVYGGAIDTPGDAKDGWDVSSAGTLGDPDSEVQVTLDLGLRFGHIMLREE